MGKCSKGHLEIAIVGAGNLGTALATSLRQANYRIIEIVYRDSRTSQKRARALARKVGARVVSLEGGKLTASLVWLCVPDGEIIPCAKALASANWKGRTTFHSSGALTSDALNALRIRGANTASVHPLMTFVPGSVPSLVNVPFALEGDRTAVTLARRIVSDIGGESFSLAKNDKALYHAWGTFASPWLTVLLEMGERVALAANIPAGRARRKAAPILHQTVENYVNYGAARGFSGPLVRGDAVTVRRHLQALRNVPHATAVYRALARAALQTLPVQNRAELRKMLG